MSMKFKQEHSPEFIKERKLEFIAENPLGPPTPPTIGVRERQVLQQLEIARKADQLEKQLRELVQHLSRGDKMNLYHILQVDLFGDDSCG